MKTHTKILFRHDAFEGDGLEGAWATPSGEYYVLDNILFYAKEYSVGDTIKCIPESGELIANELINESGHSTVRILFSDIAQVPEIREALREMNCTSELSNMPQLVAVDIPPHIDYKKIREYLDKGEQRGDWEYQEACISSIHSNNSES